LLAGVPMLDVTLAGISHGRVCTPGRLRRRGAMLRETPPPPPAGDWLSCFAKKVSKEGDPPPPVGLQPTALRCSHQAAGAERAFKHTEPLLIQGWVTDRWSAAFPVPSGAPTGGFGRREKGCACL